MPKITLKAARVNVGMTQDEVAEKMHKTKQTIINWENGFTMIKYKDLLALSELYDMPLEFLEVPEKKTVR